MTKTERLAIRAFFHEPTNTISYLIWDRDTLRGAVVDPVLDFNHRSGKVLDRIGLGRILGQAWDRVAADYRITEGGLLPLGLLAMAIAPLTAAHLRDGREGKSGSADGHA